MIILVHPRRWEQLEKVHYRDDFWREAGVPAVTQLVVDPNLPLEDDDGRPILCFKVAGEAIHYWRGEPIKLPEGVSGS